MPERNDQNSIAADVAPAPPLRRSRWQLVTAGILVALWMAFLLAMSIYS
jgi:hypothetical protein